MTCEYLSTWRDRILLYVGTYLCKSPTKFRLARKKNVDFSAILPELNYRSLIINLVRVKFIQFFYGHLRACSIFPRLLKKIQVKLQTHS